MSVAAVEIDDFYAVAVVAVGGMYVCGFCCSRRFCTSLAVVAVGQLCKSSLLPHFSPDSRYDGGLRPTPACKQIAEKFKLPNCTRCQGSGIVLGTERSRDKLNPYLSCTGELRKNDSRLPLPYGFPCSRLYTSVGGLHSSLFRANIFISS